MLMPFGCYRGIEVAELPPDYLQWLLKNTKPYPPLKAAINRALGQEERQYRDPPRASRNTSSETIQIQPEQYQLFAEIIEAGYKKVAGKKHPDVGGSGAEMIRLNLLAESLRSQLTNRIK